MLKYLLMLAFLIVVFAFVFSIAAIRKQKDREMDKGMNHTSVKHNILANPMLIAYVLFPVAVVLGAMIWMYYF
ncbi:hypothetical protein [Paenibacillus cremeus]|uniref:Short-chain dehydrogenase n=1 Tax=Paenibacillus cremeus TaxID=2163881 RepID=A0A559KE35_9BACL|nr:hypothetical protein [Paenibacillus cremeus]TVY10378.1 hypothetical protein FPZ49_08235 [Paenibacillus cremeus]